MELVGIEFIVDVNDSLAINDGLPVWQHQPCQGKEFALFWRMGQWLTSGYEAREVSIIGERYIDSHVRVIFLHGEIYGFKQVKPDSALTAIFDRSAIKPKILSAFLFHF